MSNYWPVVMWLSETGKDENTLIYRPSFSHYPKGYKAQPCHTYEEALHAAVCHIHAGYNSGWNNAGKWLDGLPSFLAKVVYQPHRPMVAPSKTKIKSYIRRIPLGENPEDDNSYSKE